MVPYTPPLLELDVCSAMRIESPAFHSETSLASKKDCWTGAVALAVVLSDAISTVIGAPGG
jgi:hypothetical protein